MKEFMKYTPTQFAIEILGNRGGKSFAQAKNILEHVRLLGYKEISIIDGTNEELIKLRNSHDELLEAAKVFLETYAYPIGKDNYKKLEQAIQRAGGGK